MTHHHLKPAPRPATGASSTPRAAAADRRQRRRVTIDTLSGAPQFVPEDPASMFRPSWPRSHARAERMRAARPHPDRPGRGRRAPKPGDVLEVQHPRREAAPGLGLQHHPPARRHAAGRLPRDAADAHPARSRSATSAACPGALELPLAPFFGVMGVAPPPGMGPHHLDRAARARRQPRQQGAGGRRDALSAGVRRGRAVLLRRRPRRPGRRRGLHHRHRDGAAGHVRARPARGSRASPTRAPRRRRTTSPWAWTPTSTSAW